MNKLKKGDIFCFDVKLNGREAFEVLEDANDKNKTVLCMSRKELVKKPEQRLNCRKSISGYVILLKRTFDV